MIGADTVTRLRADLVDDDRYNRQRRDWDNAAELTITGVSVQPFAIAGAAAEQTVDREYVASHVRLFAEFGADIVASDRVVWRGDTFDVDGEPAGWIDDTGIPDHIEVALKRLTG